MTAPKQDYRSFYPVIPVQAMCARCDVKSPVVFVRRPDETDDRGRARSGQRPMRDYKFRALAAEALRDQGWELSEKRDKSFCPTCRRMGT